MKGKFITVPRMFEQITKQIVQYIYVNKLETGTKLPTERELSSILGVSRSSLREALRILELLQFVYSRQGEGTFVSHPPPILIPYHLLQDKLDDTQLFHYFEIAMVHAEKTLLNSLKSPNQLEWKVNEKKDFWDQFHDLVMSLGNTTENPFFTSTWEIYYRFLTSNNFLKKEMDPSTIQLLFKHLLNKDEKGVIALLEKLKEQHR